MSVTTLQHYSAFVTILSARILKAEVRLRQNATRQTALRMRPACLSDENRKVWKSPEVVTTTAQSVQWAVPPYSGARGKRPPCVYSIRPDVELNSIKSPINQWEYNFIFWWID